MSRGKVHAVRKEGNVPVCGAQIGEHSQFQYCCNGARYDWIDCKHCRRWMR